MTFEYETPRIEDYGDVRDITAGRTNHTFADAVIPAGETILTHSTGPCIPTLPCTP
jgi:hypothetical protein